jgi:hypothetical protein
VKLQELKDALRAADSAAVLVSNRLLSRIIQEVHSLRTQFLQVPHHRTYVIDRQVLFRHVEQDELDLDPDRMLPPTVLLLVKPFGDDANLPDRQATLLKYWQRLFHASIDRALALRIKDGKLTTSELRERVAVIGQAEFDEIRNVLLGERALLPPVTDQSVYCEFVATYLELRYFSPNLRSVYFPALEDCAKIDALLAKDIDADALYRATRLAGAPDPKVRSDSRSDDSHEFYWRLIRDAGHAARATNHVRAAILRMRAARVAPGALTLDTRTEAHMELQRLTQRLQKALELSDADAAAWHIALVSLLEKADQGPWTVEARLLYDLQQVCIDHERDVYKLDLVEWVLSAGKKPIKRALPSQRLVQMTTHLHTASQRIPACRLNDTDRQHLTRLMNAALSGSEERLRARFRPIFIDAFHDVGLAARNPPEETAFRKMIEELLDRIIAHGFFNFSDLRDSISRNNLKLPDLDDPQEFVRGDPLLRLDRRLGNLLDGVYRPGEIYLRALARSTSLMFGTALGRFLTKNVLLPFGAPLVTLWGLEHMVNHYGGPEKLGWFAEDVELEPLWTCIPFGLFILAMMYVRRVRRVVLKGCRAVGHALYSLLFEVPIQLVQLPAVQRLWKSWSFQLLWWLVIKPLILAALVWPFLPEIERPLTEFAIAFGVAVVLLNSRPGHAVSELIAQQLLQLYYLLRSGLIEGAVRWIMYVLKEFMDFVERMLYAIDERLRFRSGDSRVSLIARALLGVIWYPIAFLTRFYIVVFVEPALHPLKLPITIIAAKLMLPVYEPIYQIQYRLLAPVVGDMAATAIATVNTWLSPDVFGFLFWELKENWRLYRANRSPVLKPVTVGHHGETVLQLLRPGIHSGTVPQLFDKLRRAERVAIATGQWRTARAFRQRLHEVEEAVRLFLERDFLVLLLQSRSWKNQPLHAGKIELATRLIRIDLEHDGHPQRPVRLCLLEKAGWLVAYIEQPGWLGALAEPQRAALTTALVGLYKFAGVDLVREEIEAGLAGTGCDYEIRAEGLVVRSRPEVEDEMVLPMHDTVRLAPGQPPHLGPNGAPVPSPEGLVFARQPVRWQRWVEVWQEEQKGVIPHLLPAGTVILPRNLGTAPPPEGEEQHRPPATVLPQTLHAGGNGPAAVRDQV